MTRTTGYLKNRKAPTLDEIIDKMFKYKGGVTEQVHRMWDRMGDREGTRKLNKNHQLSQSKRKMVV